MSIVNKLECVFGKIIVSVNRVNRHFVQAYQKSKFSRIGKSVYIGKNGIFTYQNIEIGTDVYIGANAVFQSSYGKIIIGDHVMFGPGVHIHGGNHKIRELGCYMKDVSPKSQGDDGIVTIEADCWIGSNAMILANVTIGRGSVIGANSVVTKDVPPYSIYTGSPRQRTKPRFSEEELAMHKELLRQKYADEKQI